MVLLLRYSGLRMQDAACLERSRVTDGRLFLFTQKTGTPVYCPLPPEVVTALAIVSNEHPNYLFWDAKSTRETTVKSWNRVFNKLFASATPPIEGAIPVAPGPRAWRAKGRKAAISGREQQRSLLKLCGGSGE
jgi:hypothetical protein